MKAKLWKIRIMMSLRTIQNFSFSSLPQVTGSTLLIRHKVNGDRHLKRTINKLMWSCKALNWRQTLRSLMKVVIFLLPRMVNSNNLIQMNLPNSGSILKMSNKKNRYLLSKSMMITPSLFSKRMTPSHQVEGESRRTSMIENKPTLDWGALSTRLKLLLFKIKELEEMNLS